MKKIALIVSLMFYELEAEQNMAKYLAPATLMGFVVAAYYCHCGWLSSPEYLAFVDMKEKFKESGMVLTVTHDINWLGTVIITTTNKHYTTTKNMSYSEFHNWISEYEIAKNKAYNLWLLTELLMWTGAFSALIGTLLFACE